MTERYGDLDQTQSDTVVELASVDGKMEGDTDDILFGCNECGATFRNPDDLSNHAATAGCGCSDGTDSDDDSEVETLTASEAQSDTDQVTPSSKQPRTGSMPEQEHHNYARPFGLREENDFTEHDRNAAAAAVSHSSWRKLSDTSMQCQLCGFEVARCVMAQHEKYHTGERPYMCTQCGAGFKNEGGQKIHWRTKHSHQPGANNKSGLCCSHCEAGFVLKCDLDDHVRQMHSDTSQIFVCSVCYRRFKTRRELKNHVSRHADDGSLVCVFCKRTFETTETLSEHERECTEKWRGGKIRRKQKHSTRHNETECGICRNLLQLSADDSDYELPACRHKEQAPSFSCDLCTKRFASLHMLHYHTACKHVRSMTCVVCCQDFEVWRELKAHMLTHTAEPDPDLLAVEEERAAMWQLLPNGSLRCRLCRCEVAESDILFVKTKHEQYHVGDRPHLCTQCGASFSNKGRLYVHQRARHGFFRLQTCAGIVDRFNDWLAPETHNQVAEHAVGEDQWDHRYCLPATDVSKENSIDDCQELNNEVETLGEESSVEELDDSEESDDDCYIVAS